jgi:putative transposase
MFGIQEASAERIAFRYRLNPTARQTRDLERFANARRFAYNWGLARWRGFYQETGGTIPFAQLLRELTQLKRRDGFEWLRTVDSQLLQQAQWDVRAAFENFFARRARFPRFKSRKRDRQRFRIPQRVIVDGNRVYVPKIGWVRARVSRAPALSTASATFSCDARGRWFVSLVAQFEPVEPRDTPAPMAVGIDLGIKVFAATSDGELITRRPRAARHARRLRRAHRVLSRRKRGSHNRERARILLAREYDSARAERHDWLHKLTSRNVSQYDLIAIEDLGLGGLARTKLAARLHELALWEFRRQVTYKARWAGKTVVAIDRFLPIEQALPRLRHREGAPRRVDAQMVLRAMRERASPRSRSSAQHPRGRATGGRGARGHRKRLWNPHETPDGGGG